VEPVKTKYSYASGELIRRALGPGKQRQNHSQDKRSHHRVLIRMTATENNNTAPINSFSARKEKFLSIRYQLDWISALKEQIDFANNPEVLSDFVLYLGIRKRFEE
jgi:hypothetical protein